MAHLSDEQQIEAEDDYRISVRRGSDEAMRPKKRQRKMKQEDESSEVETMTKIVHGIVHGKTIEFDEDLGVAEGQEVEVHIKVISPSAKWGEGILRTASALVDDTEWDAIMEQIYQEREGGKQ